jgi:hypothetical protein
MNRKPSVVSKSRNQTSIRYPYGDRPLDSTSHIADIIKEI